MDAGGRRARELLAQHGSIGGDQLHSTATLQDVEKFAASGYRWTKHTSDPHSYWVTTGQAAEILGLSTARIKQLAATGRLPFVSHKVGTRLFRREQLIKPSRTPPRLDAGRPARDTSQESERRRDLEFRLVGIG